ncbi:MAG TPA: hypothetical protein VF856_12180, partial [Gemmatimonadaceae bacterium]
GRRLRHAEIRCGLKLSVARDFVVRALVDLEQGGEGCPRRGTRSKSPLFGRALRAQTAGV